MKLTYSKKKSRGEGRGICFLYLMQFPKSETAGEQGQLVPGDSLWGFLVLSDKGFGLVRAFIYRSPIVWGSCPMDIVQVKMHLCLSWSDQGAL